MRALQGIGAPELVWRQPRRLRHEYELYTGDEVLATLGWESGHSQTALAEAADGRWTFQNSGYVQRQVTIRYTETGAEVAVFRPDARGGALELLGGPTFHWQATSRWGSGWTWTGEDHQEVVRFTTRGAFRHQQVVELQPAARRLPELSVLVLLGWYLLVLAGSDAAMGAAMVAVVG